MAFFLFSETPTLLVYPGGALILFGIYLVSTARRAPVQVLD
jgi:drug/metabolite transporter (DMT)-like permease